MGQCQVEIVPTENQMLADGDAMKLDFSARLLTSADQCKVTRSTANVAHQNLLAGPDTLLPVSAVLVDPSVESRLRFFNQHDARQASFGRCPHSQLTGHFVERGGERDDDLLLFQRELSKTLVPGGADVSQVP